MNKISEKISSKVLIVVFALWLLAIGASVVYCMGHTKDLVGMQVFDLKTTYNYDYSVEFLNTASSEAIDFYKNVQIPVDYALAVMLGFFPIVAMLYMKKKINIKSIFFVIALLISILDITENTLLLTILSGDALPSLVNMAGIVTLVKNLCMYTTYVVLIWFTIKYKISK